jgi:hypothetical protein
MDDNDNTRKPPKLQRDQINKLAKDAITTARLHLSPDTSARLNESSDWLETYSLKADFDADYALFTLRTRGITEDIIVDYCIPRAACGLGDDWVSDTLSFSEVSIGSAHLQMLLKSISQRRKTEIRKRPGKCLLIVVLDDEQHTLGALTLADLLRRRGYSLKVLLHSSISEVSKHLSNNIYDALLFSAGSEHIAQLSADCVKKIRHFQQNSTKTFLGGPILSFGVPDTVSSQFNLVSNNLDLLIDELENSVAHFPARATLERHNL